MGSRTGKPVLNAGALFIRHLQDRGVAPRFERPTPQKRVWAILNAFRTWMRSHRGIAESSLDTYQTTLVGLLATLGDDPEAFTVEAIRAFVLERARLHSLARAKSIAVATRAFLRFLVATGRCLPGREYAVPSFASWRLTSVPGFLGSEEIERVIAACAGERRLRDRAVILLLVRHGLRASEVANLELRDIGWGNGRLAVSCKSRRAEWLLLTQEIGDAILAYIECGRPRVGTLRLFITDRVPIRPITRCTVKGIVRHALIPGWGQERPSGRPYSAPLRGDADAPSRCQPCRRRRGASPSRSDDDDALRQGDFALLSEIAQPWAERPAC